MGQRLTLIGKYGAELPGVVTSSGDLVSVLSHPRHRLDEADLLLANISEIVLTGRRSQAWGIGLAV